MDGRIHTIRYDRIVDVMACTVPGLFKGNTMMNVEQKAGKLIITMDIEKNLAPSASGKTLIVCSSHGNQSTSVIIGGKSLVVGVNAYVRQ